MGNTERTPFHAHIFRLIDEIREQSTCRLRQVDAIAVRDKRILATGFNGAPSKAPHCTDLGFCLREQLRRQISSTYDVRVMVMDLDFLIDHMKRKLPISDKVGNAIVAELEALRELREKTNQQEQRVKALERALRRCV